QLPRGQNGTRQPAASGIHQKKRPGSELAQETGPMPTQGSSTSHRKHAGPVSSSYALKRRSRKKMANPANNSNSEAGSGVFAGGPAAGEIRTDTPPLLSESR